MNTVATILFLVAGIGNLLPVMGVFSANRLQGLYGVALEDPNLVILMRHRAVLFGIVGLILVAAAFHTPLRPLALAAGLVSMLSFVGISCLVGGYNVQLRRVVLVDLVGSVVLIGAGVANYVAHAREAAG